ncbi:hypothetical protein HK100_001694 [Physocladia obscura]|uniref:Uncharacterized protein n=1 Tax=Physocladia obscura TaxID=109957 RepID=A0AAD5SY16_9FUNG|nr:hypothetical protein HK100_001694 [Physocladia obscura]
MRRTTLENVTFSANNEASLDADNIETAEKIQTRKNSYANSKSQIYSDSRTAIDLRDFEHVDDGRHELRSAAGTGTGATIGIGICNECH